MPAPYFTTNSSRLRREHSWKGMTLPEIIVAAFLMAVVISLGMQLMLPSLALFRVQNARSEAQQGAIIATHWINHALLNSIIDSVTVGTNPVSISFCAVNEADPYDTSTGKPKPAPRFTILWHDAAERKLKVREWPPGPPPPPVPPEFTDYPFGTSENPLALSAADLRTICTSSYTGYRVLARNVESFAIDDEDGNATDIISPPLRFSIVCASWAGARGEEDRQEERFSMTTQVYPRITRW
ncbi:MAG: hypothetical protein AB9903_23460 [Vulcanimicrobiota bacterium]